MKTWMNSTLMEMKYYSFWFGLLPLACVALGAKAQHMMETKADGEPAISIPTKRIFLDWEVTSKPTEHDYAFVTQGNSYPATDYIKIQDDDSGKWLAYFDIPLNVLLANDVTFTFTELKKNTETIERQTEPAKLTYNQGRAFYTSDFETVSRKTMYEDIEAPYSKYEDADLFLGGIFNCVLADINPSMLPRNTQPKSGALL